MPLELVIKSDVPKDGEITFYENGIITKDGNASPTDFAANLQRAAKNIVNYACAAKLAGTSLLVQTGYHGSDGDGKAPGSFVQCFDTGEIATTRLYFTMFEKRVLVEGGAIELKLMENQISDSDTVELVQRGFVFFAWCYADKWVKRALSCASIKA